MDHQFTKKIQDWLNSSHDSEEEIKKGAEMLLRLNRNKFYFARACCQPRAYRSNIEYELGKFLKIRLDNMTIEQVREMNATVVPEAQAIISEGEPETTAETTQNDSKTTENDSETTDSIGESTSTDDAELPSSDSDGVAVIRKGKRADHAYLPEQVAVLWDINAKRYKEIKSVFETLKTMEDKEPCDRYEYLKVLADLDKKYRADMLTYDSYQVTKEDRERVEKEKEVNDGDQG